ncbi:MAG: HNH endonuclease [Ruminococcus sp.]|nr:HNH endonuclease [Ruminococcus sp.]
MKKACPYCGRIHEKKFKCEKKWERCSRKRGSKEDLFRWSYEWKLKREHILRRDKYLCQACMRRFPGTTIPLNDRELSVHHIRPLKTNFELRLVDENLITLCRMHHEAADKGEIRAEELMKIVSGIPPEGSAPDLEAALSNDAPLRK